MKSHFSGSRSAHHHRAPGVRLSLYKGVGMYLTSMQEHSPETLDAVAVRKVSRKNTSVTEPRVRITTI